MPSIAHLFLGGMVGYSLYLISDKKFTKYHVMLLMLANYLGPDLGWVLGIGYFTHTYFGILIFSIILAFFYSYFTRFTPDFKKRVLVDKGYNQIPVSNAFFIACAGGIMHVYLDGVMNHQGNFHLFPDLGIGEEIIVSINDFFNFMYDPRVPVSTIFALITGMSLVMGFVTFFLFLLKRMDSKFSLKIGAYMASFMVLSYFVGYLTTLHAEPGAIVYVTLFWVIPFGFIALAMKSPPPKEPTALRGYFKQKYIPLFLEFHLYFGLAFLIVGIALLFLVKTLAPVIAGLWEPLVSYEPSIWALVVLAGIILAVIGGLNVVRFVYFKKRGENNVNTIVASGLAFACGFVCLALSGIAFTSAGVIVEIIFSMFDASDIITPQGLFVLLITLGIIFGVFAGINFFAGTGTMVEDKKGKRLLFLWNAIFAWTIIGLYICCLLSQEGDINKEPWE